MNIGWTEFLVIAMIGLIVFGPERLPEMSAQFAKFIKATRTKASEATAELTKSVDTKVVTYSTRTDNWHSSFSNRFVWSDKPCFAWIIKS